MPEFELIDRLVSRIRRHGSESTCAVDIGDDAAVVDVPPGRQLVLATDTLNEDVHFHSAMPADALGHKALAVNLSDLAAMAAEPAWFLLALSLPDVNDDWLAGFADGMGALVARTGIHLAGGDTTRGPRSVTVTALGLVDEGAALTRSGARPGDLVVVSGAPGRAAMALESLRRGERPGERGMNALYYPEPRLELAARLRGKANACIDVSDGLAADLCHILEQSDLGATIHAEWLPGHGALPIEHILAGGDDYELCFSLPGEHRAMLARWSDELELELSVIGEFRRETGLEIVDAGGQAIVLPRRGYEHFSAKEGP